MKKLILFIIFAALLASCGTAEVAAGSEYIFTDYNDRFHVENGELYTDGQQRLHFVDFSTVTDALVCPKPNCAHSDEICPSFGMSNDPVIIGKNIYFFKNISRYEGESPAESVEVYKAELDGAGRVKYDVIDGINTLTGCGTAFGNGVLYFVGADMFPAGKPAGVSVAYLCGYDYAKKELVLKEPVCEGYTGNVTFCGEKGGKLYLIFVFQQEKADWQRGGSDEAKMHNAEEMKRVKITEYKTLDLETLEFGGWEIPKKIAEANAERAKEPGAVVLPVFATVKCGAEIYSDGRDSLIVSPSGREIFIEGYDGCDKAVLNGYIFDELSTGENKARRLSDGKEVTATVSAEGVSFGYAAGYCGGRYIVRYFDAESQEIRYAAEGEMMDDTG